MLETESYLNSLKNYQIETVERLKENLENVSNDILEVAKNKAPFDLGELKENSGYYVKNNENELIGLIGFMEFYAVYTHQGTGKYALKEDGRKTAWWWKATTPKWIDISKELGFKDGWIRTRGQEPKQFLLEALINNIEIIPSYLIRGL